MSPRAGARPPGRAPDGGHYIAPVARDGADTAVVAFGDAAVLPVAAAASGPIPAPVPTPTPVPRVRPAPPPPPTPVRQPGKRAFDLIVTSALLVPLSAVLAVAGLAIAVVDGRPVLYRQQRVGFRGRPFTILKLRTMRHDAHARRGELADVAGSTGLLFKVADDPRVTSVGRLLRRTSVDELPQLINVLKGEMSLVGPRPLPVAPEEFGARDGARHAVRPGITGHWQIRGRDLQDYDHMVDLDLEYIRDWSMLGDVRILLRTVPALARRTGPS